MSGRRMLSAALIVYLVQFASYIVLDQLVLGDGRCGSACWISAAILGPIVLVWLVVTAVVAGALAGLKADDARAGASGVAIGAVAFVGIATLAAGLGDLDAVLRAIAVGTVVDLAILYAGYALGRSLRPPPSPSPES